MPLIFYRFRALYILGGECRALAVEGRFALAMGGATMIDPISQLAAGARIRALRRYADWSQRDMAKFLNTDRELISRWERGLNYPGLQMVDRLCDRFQITTDYVFRGRFQGIGYEVVERLRPLAEQELARLASE